jgi:hypothetical protein
VTQRTVITEGRHYAIDPESDCWNWLLSLTRDGYGQSAHGVPAHRRSFVESGGVLLPGQPLDHLCRNRRCVNPAHLEPVTIAENTRRSLEARGLVDRETCPHGHSMADAYVHPETGKRSCRECRRTWALKWHRKNAAKVQEHLTSPAYLAAEAEADRLIAAGDLGPGVTSSELRARYAHRHLSIVPPIEADPTPAHGLERPEVAS